MVSTKFRRQNIARFISLNRIEVLKQMNVKEIYSIVDSNNLTSMKMHQEFGYIEIARADGFLHLKFNEGNGVLFKLTIYHFLTEHFMDDKVKDSTLQSYQEC